MPLYVYKCATCGHEFEKIEKLNAPHTQKCPKCKKGRAERQLSSPAFQFKGSGWYVTDYARKGAPPDKAEKSEKKEGKETAESKEGKDTKEVKEVKEAKDGKEERSKKEKKSGKDK